MDLVKRKRLVTVPEPEKPVEVCTTHLEDAIVEDELSKSHYLKWHWARATTENPVRIGDVQEPVVALVDYRSEINMMSMDFYKKGKWLINTVEIACGSKYGNRTTEKETQVQWRA